MTLYPIDGSLPPLHSREQVEEIIKRLMFQHPDIVINHATIKDTSIIVVWPYPSEMPKPTSYDWMHHFDQFTNKKTTQPHDFFVTTGCCEFVVTLQKKLPNTGSKRAFVSITDNNKLTTQENVITIKNNLSRLFSPNPKNYSDLPFSPNSCAALDNILTNESIGKIIKSICSSQKPPIKNQDFYEHYKPKANAFFTEMNEIYCEYSEQFGYKTLKQHKILPRDFKSQAVLKTKKRRNKTKKSSTQNNSQQTQITRWVRKSKK